MPSPLGHALAGVAAGWATSGADTRFRSQELWRSAVLFAMCGMFPDVDLLFGMHRGPTHSLGAAAIAGLVILAFTRSMRVGLAAAAAYGSHAILDWLGSDSSPPIGIMALWPLSTEYFESEFHLFDAISRRYGTPGFWEHNVNAVARELLILIPPTVLVLLLQRYRSRANERTQYRKKPCPVLRPR